jgi:hypothetical protein
MTDQPMDRPTMTDEAILAIAVLLFFVAPALLMGASAVVAYVDYIKKVPR